MSDVITRNTRVGGIALAVFAPTYLLLSWHGATLAPLAFVSWLGVCFGVLCLIDELGPAKPLNRAGMILFGAAFCARVVMIVSPDPSLYVRVELLFAFAVMGALQFWSIALMHRRQAPRTAGILGTAMTGSALLLILAAHVLVGSATVWGFSGLFAALADPASNTSGALTAVNAILCLWALVCAYLLWSQKLGPRP